MSQISFSAQAYTTLLHHTAALKAAQDRHDEAIESWNALQSQDNALELFAANSAVDDASYNLAMFVCRHVQMLVLVDDALKNLLKENK